MKKEDQRLKVLQINLHHSRAASAALCVAMRNCDVALIQEPWIYKKEIKGLKEVGGELIYSRFTQHPRTCILVKKGFQILPLMHHCSRDLTAVKIKTSTDGGPREIILGSAYFPYNDNKPPPPGELEKLVMECRAVGTHLIIGCDANAHHTSWGSSDINNRGESLFNYIMANGLDIMNKGNRPTFVTSNRQEVIDITIATLYAGNFIKDWHVTEEVSCSDHRYIQFTVTGIDRVVEGYRNPRRADWESFRTDLSGGLHNMTNKISNCIDLETAARQFQDTIVSIYNENCPLTVRQNTRNISWWNQDLAERRKKVRRLFNAAKKSGNWTDYKRNLTDYNKALRQAKRESWRRHCEEIEKAPECARLHRVLSKDRQSAIGSIQLENGEYTSTERSTLEELLRVHFPGSEIILEPPGGWDGLELELPKWKGSREDWAFSRRVISYEKLKWAIFSFQPYKSPGIDGIMPIMLQQGFELLAGKLLMLLRASLALGYIPMSWRHIRVVFIPKPGKSLTQAKSLRPISLMSFILKTLEKVLDRHIRDGVMVEKPLHQNQFAYRAGVSTDAALFQVVHRLEKSLHHKEFALGAFLDIEGAFDNTSFNAIITAARERGLEETCCRWVRSMLESRLVYTSIMGSSLTAKIVGGCPQGGVLSPLL